MTQKSFTDRELVRMYQRGNQQAFATLLTRHKQKIFSVIFYLVRDKDIAEDLFQDTFVKVINTLKSGNYKEENKFSAWVARIAHNLVIDYFRVEKHMPKLRDKEEYSIFDRMRIKEDNAETSFVNNDMKEKLHHLISQLQFEQREVLIMRIYGDLSFKEIAKVTHVSINTALGRMRYATLRLRELVRKNNINLLVEFE